MTHRSDQEPGGSSPGDGLAEEAKEKADQPKAEVGGKANELGTKAKEKSEELRAGAEEKARELSSKAKHKMEEASEAAGRAVSDGAARAGERLRSVVGALHAASDRLDEEGDRWLAGYAREAAGQVEHLSAYLVQNDAGRMTADLEEKARARPGAFLGGTLATGFVVGRFLRASGRRAGARATATSPGETGGDPIMPPATPPAVAPTGLPHEQRARRETETAHQPVGARDARGRTGAP